MSDRPCYFITTAIDYPNSRPHIGTAFEKLGADVQARYRRMEGFDVFFLMGNDENTVKVLKRAQELGQEPKLYCDEMARQFREVWQALDLSYDDFIQTSEDRHHRASQAFIQKVYDAGYIYKGTYEGWYCEGSESFKTDKEIAEAGGKCDDGRPPVRRTEPCYYFALSRFQDWLLDFYDKHPDFIQPESRRNEVIALVKGGLQDVNITRTGQKWGIRVPFDEEFTIYVWFDALINYITAIGYGSDPQRFQRYWPADVHVIGKDITRFHCALWPAMLHAAGLPPPKMVFGHGFVYLRGEKISKSLGNVVEPMDLITKFNAEAFRYYFLKECPFPGDGDFSWERFEAVYNADLANNLGNLLSRSVRILAANLNSRITGSAGRAAMLDDGVDTVEFVRQVRDHVEGFRYNQALQLIWQGLLVPTNQLAERKEPWKLVKTDPTAAGEVLFSMIERLRVVAIVLKPFLPRTAEALYRSFNFTQSWETVRYADAAQPAVQVEDLHIVAELEGGKAKPLFPRIA